MSKGYTVKQAHKVLGDLCEEIGAGFGPKSHFVARSGGRYYSRNHGWSYDIHKARFYKRVGDLKNSLQYATFAYRGIIYEIVEVIDYRLPALDGFAPVSTHTTKTKEAE